MLKVLYSFLCPYFRKQTTQNPILLPGFLQFNKSINIRQIKRKPAVFPLTRNYYKIQSGGSTCGFLLGCLTMQPRMNSNSSSS